MQINGEALIITTKKSPISSSSIVVRLIAEFTSVDQEIKTFCYRNDLGVWLDKNGNYVIDLAEQLGFVAMSIEKDFTVLALPLEIDEEQFSLLENCQSIFNASNNLVLYYYEKEDDGYNFRQKLVPNDVIKRKDFVKNYLKDHVKVVSDFEDKKVKSKGFRLK